MGTNVKLKPGKWLYLIGVLIIVVGIVVAIAISAVAATQVLNNSITATVPGQSDLNLDKLGTYAITYDYNPANGGKAKITNLSDYSGLKYTLTEKSDNSDVPITTVAGSVMEFKISSPGTYTLSAAYGSGSGPSAVVMIVSAGQSAISVVIIAIFLVCLIAGVLVIIMTAVKRKKNRASIENK